MRWLCVSRSACDALKAAFGISGSGSTRRRSHSTIMLLDEIDMLMTKDQEVCCGWLWALGVRVSCAWVCRCCLGCNPTRSRAHAPACVLSTHTQVLYQLFDWPNQPGSRLAVLGISNTHDLDQRVLPRIASRLDQAKLPFAPYSAEQLEAIVAQRLAGSELRGGAVEELAVTVACRKVAVETGARV
jgi:Cdc6-like AAA superfamily ATPase